MDAEKNRMIFLALIVVLNGIWELRRIWRYFRDGTKDPHWFYRNKAKQIERYEGKKASQKYIGEILKNWNKEHLIYSIFIASCTLIGLMMLVSTL
ncbi:MAG: hypothetical protein KIT08_02750 [Anaerolineales bacterium]|nr:MAG: hypothetical protein KIT08_02750 [Anaerolineales bacterium]